MHLDSYFFLSKVPYKWWTRESTDEMAAIICLATKYQAEDLRAHFIDIFKKAWPDTFDEWGRRETDVVARSYVEPGPMSDHAELFDFWLPDPGQYCRYRTASEQSKH